MLWIEIVDMENWNNIMSTNDEKNCLTHIAW